MVAVSGGLIFIGYQLMVYGLSQVRHGNAGFFDILWPGRYTGLHPDSGTGITYTPGKGLNDVGAGGTIGLPPQKAAPPQKLGTKKVSGSGLGTSGMPVGK